MKDLKEKTIRGGGARGAALASNFLVRVGSMMILARLLEPKDFGLLGMVTAFTGVLSLFRDFGLSTAAIQRADVTEEQMSTLFWINVLTGAGLTLVTGALAPAGRRSELVAYLRALVAERLRRDPSHIGEHAPLARLGVDSLMAVELARKLEEKVGTKLYATLLFEANTIAAVVDRIEALRDDSGGNA